MIYFYSLSLNKLILISKTNTVLILISNNTTALWGEDKKYKTYFQNSIKSIQIFQKDWVILTLNKHAYLKMSKVENDLDTYYAVGNANTQRQENEIATIIKKRNSEGWKLISTSTAIVDTKNNFSNLYLFWEKKE